LFSDWKKNFRNFKKIPKVSHLVVGWDGGKSSIRKFGESAFVSHNDLFPFVNRYETPKTLGIDRMVLALSVIQNIIS
jgi:type III pantothenate kinase